ncbi:hypothetical protein [Bacillus toyonensis]|uniref:hypothetical protein n=1 Tax=Bacillus toyonensis TaxID=155322 RepID=UPI000BFC375D|nr:hypothetical protein [Bacillus toyonensis]PHB48334.1 hypothetical protein COE91_22785 [Bacillus toyonensis]
MGWKNKLKPPKSVRKAVDKIADQVDAIVGGIEIDLEGTADKLAIQYKEDQPNGDFEDCVVVVAAGCAAGGAALGGPLGAALGAGAGVPVARIACRRIFPE